MRVNQSADRNLSLTLQWRNAVVRDLPARLPFTFRLRLWASGLVEFLYNKLGLQLRHLLVLDSNVRIGLGETGQTALEIARKSVKEKTLISISRLSSPVLSRKEDIAISSLCYDAALVGDQEKAKKLWVNMMEANTGRANQVVKLPFPFPFFGSLNTEAMLTADGTISLEARRNKHRRLITAWRNLSRPLEVKYSGSSDSFTVEWEGGTSQGRDKTLLQITLRPTGDLDFVYQAEWRTG